jgi:hypothetical protein
MADQNDDTRAPAARRSVHRYLPSDDPNFSIRDPQPHDPLADDPRDVSLFQNDDPATDDPVLVKYAGKGALVEAREQIGNLNRDALAKLKYELIDQHVSMAMADGRTRKQAMSYAVERFNLGEKGRTVETALDDMKQKREAEAARTPAPFAMTPEAEAKAREHKADEAESKAKAKARFLDFLVEIRSWLNRRSKVTATKRDSLQ